MFNSVMKTPCLVSKRLSDSHESPLVMSLSAVELHSPCSQSSLESPNNLQFLPANCSTSIGSNTSERSLMAWGQLPITSTSFELDALAQRA